MCEPKSRPVGNTELSWCKASTGGTGSTVIALLFSKIPNITLLQSSLQKLQLKHPLLNSTLNFNSLTNSFSYFHNSTPYLQIHNEQVTEHGSIYSVLEHELNQDTWVIDSSETNVFFASCYALQEEKKWVVTLRLHTSVCDRASAVALLKELLELVGKNGGDDAGEELEKEEEKEISLPIEEYIPNGQGSKPFWARGVDMLGYSLNSFRLSNLGFCDTETKRSSRVVRLELNVDQTRSVLSSCEEKDIKLCSLLASAGLIASYSSKGIPEDQWEKYAVVTLIDCRSILDPVLSNDHIGFYHSAILNSHDIKKGENIWDLAKRVHSSFINAKNNKKHFSDMADLNFLMCKAIENPGLTPSASLRTSLISVFEDPVINNSTKLNEVIGLEDFIGCASVHGVGPSMAVFDTIRDGKLDCACVYPFPLHSREQMQEFVEEMKRIILN